MSRNVEIKKIIIFVKINIGREKFFVVIYINVICYGIIRLSLVFLNYRLEVKNFKVLKVVIENEVINMFLFLKLVKYMSIIIVCELVEMYIKIWYSIGK